MSWLEAARALVARYEKHLLVVALAFPVVRFIHGSSRYLTFDELFTFHISALGDLGRIAAAAPGDGQPLLYYLLAHASQRLFGATEAATRAPSLLAFLVALVCLYLFVRRHGPAIAALFAVVAVETAEIKYLGTEARPYALMMGFAALALVSWQVATERTSRRLVPLIVMALAIAGAIGSNHFGAFQVAIPLVSGEAWRLMKRRRLDLPVYAAGLAGAATLGLTVPLMERTHQVLFGPIVTAPNFYFRPSVTDLGSYLEMINPWLVIAFAVVALLLPRPHAAVPGSDATARAIPGHELAAAVALALLLPIVIAVASLVAGQFAPRYAISTALGLAILLGFAVTQLDRSAPRGSIAAMLCIALLGVGMTGQYGLAWLEARLSSPAVPQAQSRPVLAEAPADLPIAVADPYLYFTMWWYAPADLRPRLHYLADASWAVHTRQPLPELSLIADREFVPSKVDDYRQFIAAHREFLVYCRFTAYSGPGDCQDIGVWLPDRLVGEGYTLSLLAKSKRDVLLLAKKP